MKKIPIGTEDFKEIIENNSYYIDKTEAIIKLEDFGSSRKVHLFARPRRFGKTLFMSTLDYFYNQENAEENRKLFDNLSISKSKYFKNQGKYPVISISMKDIRANTYSGMLESYYMNIIKILQTINNFDIKDTLINDALDKIKNNNEVALSTSLKLFSEIFYNHYNKKVILLIDEYEAPILNAYQSGYIDKALQFFSSLYSSALKTNPYLERAVITGITRISQSNIFSGLNNVNIYSMEDDDFSDTFGFTKNEVKKALKEYGLEEYEDKVKDYYDGYLFGNTEIYNPWSILNFLDKKQLKPYWTSTSSTEIISNLLKKAPNYIKQTYSDLTSGKSVYLKNTDPGNLIIKDLDNPHKVFAYMIASGYITYEKDGKARIVNKEIISSIAELSAYGLYNIPDDYIYLSDSLRIGNFDGIGRHLNSLFDDTFSYMDMTKTRDEASYHMILTSMLYTMGLGKVYSNKESGSGRADIILKSFYPENYSYVFEIKIAQTKEEISKKLDEGLFQIKNKNYLKELKDYNKKMIMCLCFYKKEIHIKHEEIK